MKKILLLVVTLLFITGCGGTTPTEKLEESLKMLNEADSLSIKYLSSIENSIDFELIANYDFANQSFEFDMENRHSGETYEDQYYYLKADDGYDYFYMDSYQWYRFNIEEDAAYSDDFMLFENKLENIFSFLNDVEENDIEKVSDDEYIVKIFNQDLYEFIIAEEGYEIEYFEISLQFDGDMLNKISFDVDVYDTTATYSWEIMSINEYNFEVPEEVLNVTVNVENDEENN